MVSQQTTLTANNHGRLVDIIAWVTLAATCLATGIKIGVKYSKIRGIERDDLYMLGAVVSLPYTLYDSCTTRRSTYWSE